MPEKTHSTTTMLAGDKFETPDLGAVPHGMH